MRMIPTEITTLANSIRVNIISANTAVGELLRKATSVPSIVLVGLAVICLPTTQKDTVGAIQTMSPTITVPTQSRLDVVADM